MDIGTLLSTILLVSFIVTIILAVGSYMAYKFRERRRPRDGGGGAEGPVYFERYDPSSRAVEGEDRFTIERVE
jgi:heme/copper-type cytochrome/quinol oxidase subunit 2